MSSTSVTPTTATPLPTTWVDNWERLIKAHEKLIIVIVLAFAGFHFYSTAIDAWDRHDSRTAQQAAATVKTDAAVTKDDSAQLAALQKQVAEQTAIIAQEIVQRNQATKTQQATDATLPPTDLAARWATLIKTDSPNIHPITGNQYQVTNDAAVSTVQALEEVPTLEANNASIEIELKNDEDIIGKQATVIVDLNTELTDEKKSHVADVAAQKVKTRHALIRGVKIGFVIGFVAGLFGGHAVGY